MRKQLVLYRLSFICLTFILWNHHLFSQNEGKRLITKGDSSFFTTNYVKAQNDYIQALEIAEKNEDFIEQSMALQKIGLCHYYLRDKPTAIKWFHQSLKISQREKLDSLITKNNYYLGVMYVELDKKDSALYYTNKAIEDWKQHKNYSSVSRSYSILSELFIFDKNTTQEAEEIIQQAEEYAQLSGDKKVIGFAAIKRYFLNFYNYRDYQKALEYINIVEEASKDSKFLEDKMYAYRFKAECLAKLQDTTAADYMIDWFKFKDSIFNVKKVEEMSRFEVLYETHQKENKIAEQKIQLLEEKNEKTIITAIGIIVILIISAGSIYYRRKQKMKTQFLLQQQNEKSVQEIYAAEQNERIRIARDLHDSIGQKLAVVKMLLSAQKSSDEIKKISHYLDETTQEVRSISHNLIPEILNFGLLKAIESLTDQISATQNLKVELFSDKKIEELQLDKQTELSLYRIIQEIVANIIKHSESKFLKIEIKNIENFIQISIFDKGKGFEKDLINESSGLGWKNIFARIKLINGEIKIQSDKKNGSNFFINIPIT